MIITNTYIYFYGGPFSNWYCAKPLLLDPITNIYFDSTEQLFMFYKADFFKDAETRIKIIGEFNPKEVKALGKQVKGFKKEAWDCVSFGYMVYVNYLKYSQNSDLKQILLETEERILVEASPYDKIWGIGLSVEDARAGMSWQGQNLLGEALMEVRKMLT